ncbi:MAG TPA: hypothetical protein PKL15_11210 [Saprospiraceae bacterium]|nr:hypothetical protein [Saprospiraceae bacterium]HNM25994.1 hypothetical protein [Saprospiraceae bacterium]
MKQIVFLLFFLAGTGLWAQKSQNALSAADEATARAATEQLVAKYKLNADQAKQMYTIQARKMRNMAAIESIKNSDPTLYLAKKQSVLDGSRASIRRILNTREQVELFEKTKVETRTRQAEKRKEMMQAGASKQEIEAAVLDLNAE